LKRSKPERKLGNLPTLTQTDISPRKTKQTGFSKRENTVTKKEGVTCGRKRAKSKHLGGLQRRWGVERRETAIRSGRQRGKTVNTCRRLIQQVKNACAAERRELQNEGKAEKTYAVIVILTREFGDSV